MKRIEELDGLRALAIISVLIVHDGLPLAQHLHLSWFALRGWVGVDLFFVLSGFLITRILLDSKSKPGYFARFYTRRALRIWPLYYVWVLFILVLTKNVALIGAHTHSIPAWQFLIFVQNFNPGIIGVGVLTVTWSLAIEEQFYFVWPLVVYKAGSKAIGIICLAILAAEPALRALAPHIPLHPCMVYLGTAFHLDGLAFGGLAAVIYGSRELESTVCKRLAWSSLVLGASASALLVRSRPDSHFNHPFEFTAVSLMWFGLVVLTLLERSGIWSRLMRCRPLRFVSTVSYCVYLIHVLVNKAAESPWLRAKILRGHTGLITELFMLVTQLVLVFALSYLSWTFFESKILLMKDHMTFGQKEIFHPVHR
jgi:peptidoglycan/LPS O-acetylase OafA/YrhL